jgi:NADPH:quinone reductase-like Zn-dependent oxidoreductase
VLIKAEAIGVIFVDTYFRSGLYPRELPFVLGAEAGGTVAAVADGVTAVRVGDRVATADAIGAYAEYCIAAADVVAPVPDAVTTDVAAAAVLKGMTSHLLIKSVYPVQEGHTASLGQPGDRARCAIRCRQRTCPNYRSVTLNAAGSVCLTWPSRPHFMRTREEFTWRTGELFTAIAAGTIQVTVSRRCRLTRGGTSPPRF